MRPSSRAILNLVLLALVAAVGAYLYFQSDEPAAAGKPLMPVALEKVERIEIERASGMRIALARSDGQWRMQAPVAARLDEVALARVLELARVRSAQHMPAAELARFELDKPWARVRFDQHLLELGMSNTLTQELYVKSGEEVVTIPARLAANIPADASKLIAHRLFGPQEQPAAFRLEHFGVREDAGRWRVEPGPGDVSQDDLLRWVDQWRLASSILTQPQTSAPVRTRLEIDLRGGSTVTLGVIATTPDLVLRREDERLDYHFPARLAAVLFAAPGSAAEPRP